MLVASKYTNAYDTNAKIEKAYLNAFLLSNFGIVVDKPELLTKEMVKDISDVYKLEVPASYFKNPQDTRFYTAEELLIEQCVSYFLAYGAEDSHVKVFDKELPELNETLEDALKVYVRPDQAASSVEFPAGTEITYIDLGDGWGYVTAKLDGETVKGFTNVAFGEETETSEPETSSSQQPQDASDFPIVIVVVIAVAVLVVGVVLLIIFKKKNKK
jgi:hypothetical protein